jgi:phenylacetic acid degradation operon negative regulatory protein
VTADDAARRQPRSLIVTVYGLYAREVGGWLSVSSLIRLLAELGVDEPAVRSSISRLKRRGMLEPVRVDGVAGYAVSDSGLAILRDGDYRIFGRPAADVSDGWLLAVFSVPESERAKRHQLRARLAWLGFGTAAPGVWIAPATLHDEAVETLRRLGLDGYVDLFRSDYVAFADPREAVATWWDLEELQVLYLSFLAAYRPVLARWRRRRSLDEAAAFGDYVRALTEWRRLPYLDPGLPRELLPRRWHGSEAAELFGALHDRLSGPAARHVLDVTGAAPRSAAAARD